MPNKTVHRPLEHDLINHKDYDPDRLLDFVITGLKLRNDAALSRELEIAPPIISKIRKRRVAISNNVLLRIHDVTQEPVNKLRKLMGAPEFRTT